MYRPVHGRMLRRKKAWNHPRGAGVILESLSPPKGPVLAKFESDRVKPSQKAPCITSCNYLASYTRLDPGELSILVPGILVRYCRTASGRSQAHKISGRPPLWTPVKKSLKLKETGYPKWANPKPINELAHPWEASFEAIRRQESIYDLNRTDIVTCSATLRDLFDFVRGLTSEIRFIMERIGKTVVFVRREVPAPVWLPESDIQYKYEAEFTKRYTKWEDIAAEYKAHQRIVRYNFAGINIVVRSASDAYIPNQDLAFQGGSASTNTDKANITSLTEGIGGLQVHEGGKPIAQNEILHTDLRSMYNHHGHLRKLHLSTVFPRLWASQVSNVAVAYHKEGVMKSVRVSDMKDEILNWECENKDHLSRLAGLLNNLTGYARASPSRLEVCRSSFGPLEIRKLADQDSPKAVSPEMRLCFDKSTTSRSGPATNARR
ncbi:hypothetical protein AtubIFM55763_004944 [Aspergillus tubingensis]|nr:hypothetical protein AtubIFM55763_004944 [Aspergillus tubingensis]